jgi:deazaflavin-dependent oxidoreductase (nitroreductase family)
MSDFNTGLIDDLRANGGHASTGPFVGKQVLILTTTGAKSGQRRETPLAYSIEGDDIVIVASMGGAPQHPSWYHNLVANPNVQIEVDGKTYDATATVVDETERRRLYDAHTEIFPGFAEYEARTGGRVIPVIVLHKVAARAIA